MHNNYLYFAFYSDFFDPDIITRELGIEPTAVKLKKHPVPIETSWDYKIEAGNDIDLEKYLEKAIGDLHTEN